MEHIEIAINGHKLVCVDSTIMLNELKGESKTFRLFKCDNCHRYFCIHAQYDRSGSHEILNTARTNRCGELIQRPYDDE